MATNTSASSVVRVPSLSEPGVDYIVTRTTTHTGDAMRCTCPAFPRSEARRCKHTDIVRLADSMVAACATAQHHAAPGALCRTCVVAVLARMAGKVKREFVPKQEAREKVAAARKRRAKGGAHGRKRTGRPAVPEGTQDGS